MPSKLRFRYTPFMVLALILSFVCEERLSADSFHTEDATGVEFPSPILEAVPGIHEAPEFQGEGVQSMFYDGEDYQGRPTRVFAWYGVPLPKDSSISDGSSKSSQKFPAMVLIHGGGGTAFDNWVRLWNSRGYAAIAMDLCGCVPVGEYSKWKRHEHGGPPGWDASFEQLESPITDQWTWHAVTAVARANSLLRSFPEIDAERIGVTGISWGGYLTSIVSGVDHRFRFAVPVYGCGYLGENSAWLPAFEKMGKDKAGLWLKQWDPSGYLKRTRVPVLWVNGTNDFAYPMDSWRRSSRLPKSERTLCLRIRMPHAHGPAGEAPEEIRVFADHILNNGTPLPSITEQGSSSTQAWCTYKSQTKIVSAELAFTRASGRWQDRLWESLPAKIDHDQCRVTAEIPADATVFYLNIFDDRNCAVSTEHIDRSEDQPAP
ncbi:MAG: alpha/beta hydrolase family protein [Planctomyces sp.]|jgi:dienelactone hydrolase